MLLAKLLFLEKNLYVDQPLRILIVREGRRISKQGKGLVLGYRGPDVISRPIGVRWTESCQVRAMEGRVFICMVVCWKDARSPCLTSSLVQALIDGYF